MRSEKHYRYLMRRHLTNIELCLLFDSVGGDCAIASAEDSESCVWVILDLVIDFPKLALICLLASVRRWLQNKHHLSDECWEADEKVDTNSIDFS